MRFAVAFLTCLGLAAPMAQAGAWPREKGTGFASVSVRLAWPQDIRKWTSPDPIQDYSTLYFEYGLTERLTLGLDLGHSVSGSGKTVVFVQYPVRNSDTGPKASAQLGVGMISGDRVVRPGLSVGWGLDKGWISVDSVVEAHLDRPRTDYKVDFTWGRNLNRGKKLIVQLQTGQPEGRAGFARIAPSLVVPLRERLLFETGATFGLTGDDSVGLKLGIWAEF